MRRAPFKKTTLSPQDRELWENTLAAMSWTAPGFIHILYTLLHNTGDEDVALFTDDPQMMFFAAATDGYQLIINPALFFKYDLMERVFILCHEIMHECLNHARIGWHYKKLRKVTVDGKSLPWDSEFANIVQDFVINAILISSKMGKYNTNWLYDPKIATDQSHWLDVYFKLWKDLPRIKVNLQCRGQGQGDHEDGEEDDDSTSQGSPQQFDGHPDPHQSAGADPQEVPERNEAQWEIEINIAMEIQQAQGKLPAALKMFFDDLLKPKVDWTDHIRGLFLRIMGSGAYDWRRLDRRLVVRGIGAPGITGHGAGCVVVGGDTSMSVFHNREFIARWLGEIAGMVEDVQPEETHVVWCDTEVKRADICTDPSDVRKMIYDGIPGGGGTIFKPVFKYVEDNDLRPDVLVYLTDGDGSFPEKEPEYPVIWGDISGDPKKYPWGTVVHIPVGNT